MAFLPIAGAALAAGGQLLSGIEERGALKGAARADRENANRTEFQGELDSWQTTREARLAQGAGLAMSAADGNVTGTGTVADLVEQAALEREMEIGNLRARARGEATNLRSAAAAKDKAAKFALIKGVLGAAASVATSISDMKNQKKLDGAAAADRASKATGPLGRGLSGSGAGGSFGSKSGVSLLMPSRTPWGSLPSGRG